MKKLLLLLLALGLVKTSLAQNLNLELDSVMNAYQRVHRFNGAVLIAKNGQVLLKKGYGYRNFSTATLNDANSVYMIASVTKQFTAVVVLKLAADHRMKLSDPLSKYFPAYPNGNHITIYHLLTHTAGIPDYSQDSVFMATHKSPKVSENLIQYNKVDFAPGTNWKYSNAGYQLLGEIIAKVSGMTYFKAVRHYIFSPLHMTHSGFDYAALKGKAKATGYWTWPQKGQSQEATIIDSSKSFAAGSIYSTVGDLYKWHKGLQTYQLVPKALMDKAYTPFKNHYGFGWSIDTLFGKRVLSHSGDTWGFNSNIARVTGDDVCVILLNNIEDEEMRGPLTNDLLAVLYHQPYKLPVYHQEIKVSEAILKTYTGTYQLTPQMSLVVTLDGGQLWGKPQPSNQPPIPLYAGKQNTFFTKVDDLELEFVADSQSHIVSVVFTQGDHRIEGKKMP